MEDLNTIQSHLQSQREALSEYLSQTGYVSRERVEGAKGLSNLLKQTRKSLSEVGRKMGRYSEVNTQFPVVLDVPMDREDFNKGFSSLPQDFQHQMRLQLENHMGGEYVNLIKMYKTTTLNYIEVAIAECLHRQGGLSQVSMDHFIEMLFQAYDFPILITNKRFEKERALLVFSSEMSQDEAQFWLDKDLQNFFKKHSQYFGSFSEFKEKLQGQKNQLFEKIKKNLRKLDDKTYEKCRDIIYNRDVFAL